MQKQLFVFVLVFVSLTVLSPLANALSLDADLMQSSPAVEWETIENDWVQLIYPKEMKSESVYVTNLVDHYSNYVGLTYGIHQPRKFTLILRPEVAQPNGYVTLGPRRSEWFASSVFFPYVGGTEWYQTLSIHEYRHVNQFDHFRQKGTKIYYGVMGEFGWQLAVAMVLPSWFMEGDAVWSETKYTDGGRGRSPRFLARLKALVLSDKIPTYDQFLSGSYRTEIPNQYVYGYALVSYATQKFGDDVWAKVLSDAARFPLPLRFYFAFENVTKQRFEDFYNEAMNDLKTKWAKDDKPDGAPVDFREYSAPFKIGDSLYYIKETLETYAELTREQNGKTEVLARFPFNREIVGLDMKVDKAVYTEYLPHARYQQKGSSDLFSVDLKSGKRTRLTRGERIYNPSLNQSATKIIATEFAKDQSWRISEFDLSGKRLKSFALPSAKVAEARYLDDSTAIVLLNSLSGYKSIATVDMNSQALKQTLLPSTRNLFHALYVDKNQNVVFEAQYKGANEIFALKNSKVLQCTKSSISSFTPSSDGENVHFTTIDTYGSVLSSVRLADCQPLVAKELADFNFIGEGPSDNYNKFPPQAIATQEQMYTAVPADQKPKPYGDFDSRLLVPHTWGLLVGRGSALGAESDNYLRTLGLSALLGSDAEEGGAFAQLNFDIKKYYPLFRLQLENRGRDVEDFSGSDKTEWTETTLGIGTLIPYVYKNGVKNFNAQITGDVSYLNADDYKRNDVEIASDANHFLKTSAGAAVVWYTDLKHRSIIAPWLLSYRVRYEDATEEDIEELSSYRLIQGAALQTPGILRTHGLRVAYQDQKHTELFGAYRFLPESSVFTYAFSRGYSYEDTPYYQKLTADYFFPIAYPDMNWGRFYYLNRIYASVFFDTTRVKEIAETRTLDSYGAEAYFESKIIRFIPLTLGLRVLNRVDDNRVRAEVFAGTSVGF